MTNMNGSHNNAFDTPLIHWFPTAVVTTPLHHLWSKSMQMTNIIQISGQDWSHSQLLFDTKLICLKALLIEHLIQDQNADPTSKYSMAWAMSTKASYIPNNESQVENCIKEMKDIDKYTKLITT
jgi:hypothetical protein